MLHGKNKNPQGFKWRIHSGRSTVSRWATRFRDDRVSMEDDERPGRPKTSTN